MSFWVLSQFEFWSFIRIWVFGIHHNLSFFSFIRIWVFEFYQKLRFGFHQNLSFLQKKKFLGAKKKNLNFLGENKFFGHYCCNCHYCHYCQYSHYSHYCSNCHYCHYCHYRHKNHIGWKEGRFFFTILYSKGNFFTKVCRPTDRQTDQQTTRLLGLLWYIWPSKLTLSTLICQILVVLLLRWFWSNLTQSLQDLFHSAPNNPNNPKK